MSSTFAMLVLSILFQNNSEIIFDFQAENTVNNWTVVNDGVMGGLSQGSLAMNKDGNAMFSGLVTTENNGGFSSIRHDFGAKDVSPYAFVLLRIKGDGKAYQFRIKEDSAQRHSYISSFETTGDWETIRISLKDFYPSFRGRTLDIPNFKGSSMQEVAILIGNKKKERFDLEIQRISLE